jgi:uncharacterized protein (TIGR03382 family)
MKFKSTLVTALIAAGSASISTAAIVASGSSNTSEGFYNATISTTDLLAGTTPVVTGYPGGSVDTNAIYDGVTVDSSLNATSGNIYLNTNPNVVMTFDLNGSVTGYDITSIASIAGWNTNAHNHAPQFYQVEVSLVGSATYTSLNITGSAAAGGIVFYDPFASGQGSTRVTVTEDTSGVLASGVDSIRFTLISTPDGLTNDTVYKEIDVFGTATVIPEPSTALLGGLGVLALLRRRRH